MGRKQGSKNRPKYEAPRSVPIPTTKPSSRVVRNDAFETLSTDTVLSGFDMIEDTPMGKITGRISDILYNKTSNTLIVKNKAQDLMNLYKDLGTMDRDKYKELNVSGDNNKDYIGPDGSFMHDTKDKREFTGGTTKDIFNSMQGKFNQSEFIAKREDIKKSFSKLKDLEQLITRRRVRYMSEHEGELDFDRIWELNPFHATKFSNNGTARTMTINVEFCLSAGVSSESINSYGATVWAVIDMLENAGIQCSVNLAQTFNNVFSRYIKRDDSKAVPNKVRILTNIKNAGDYIDTMDIARCFTANFYRRVLFNSWVAMAEGMGLEIAYGLGNPYSHTSGNNHTKGELNFKIEQMSNFKLNQDELINYIKEAL